MPTTDLSELKFSLFAKIAETREVNPDLSFQGKIKFNSSLKINNLTSLVSNLNTIKTISGILLIGDTEGLDTVLQRDSDGWKIILKSSSPSEIPEFIRNLDIVVLN